MSSFDTLTVREQGRRIRKQVISGTVQNKKIELGEKFDRIWGKLQEKGIIKGDDEKQKVVDALCNYEIECIEQKKQHEREKEKAGIIKRKWKQKRDGLDEIRAVVHQMAVAGMALQLRGIKKESEKEDKLETQSSAPPYSMPPCPPYQAMQMPVLEVKTGRLVVDVIGDRDQQNHDNQMSTRSFDDTMGQVQEQIRRMQEETEGKLEEMRDLRKRCLEDT